MNDAESVRSLIAANAYFANDSSAGIEAAVESWVQTFANDGVFVVDRYAIEKRERLRSFHRAVLSSGHAFAKHFICGSVVLNIAREHASRPQQ
jgi:hypothetical protein